MKTIAIHASMTPATDKIGKLELDKRDRAFGYFSISYHYVIDRTGYVELGRPVESRSPHEGDVVVCLVGGADEQGAPQDNFTDDQKTALVGLVSRIQKDSPARAVSYTPAVEQHLLDTVYNS